MEKMMDEGLIFDTSKHSLEENCPITAVNASRFLPCELQNKIRRSFAK